MYYFISICPLSTIFEKIILKKHCDEPQLNIFVIKLSSNFMLRLKKC